MNVWVDCTAAAHPLVLRPIIERLEAAGHQTTVTAREYGQTVGVLQRLGIPYTSFGRHGGSRMLAKGGALVTRSARLWHWARGRDFALALAHGSVDIALVAKARRIPLVQMNDYEYAGLQRKISFRAARLVIAPQAIGIDAMERAGVRPGRLFRYPGLKEDYYLADFRPDSAVLDSLGIDRRRALVVLRPPPETSEYHQQNDLYAALLQRLGTEPDTTTVVIPRTRGQAAAARAGAGSAGPSGGGAGAQRLIVPDREVDAQSLIAFADLVVSAGGTMNREAVALGTPVYTIFSGELGAVDAELIEKGLLRPLMSPADLRIERRTGEPGVVHPRDPVLLSDAVIAAAEASATRSRAESAR